MINNLYLLFVFQIFSRVCFLFSFVYGEFDHVEKFNLHQIIPISFFTHDFWSLQFAYPLFTPLFPSFTSPTSHSPPLATTSLFSEAVSLIFVFLDLFDNRSYGICLSLYELFHLAYCPQGPYMLWQDSFLFIVESYSPCVCMCVCVCVSHNFFVHLSVDGHLGCFNILA